MKPLLRRIAAVSVVVALGSCLWRPPIIPPLNSPDASATRDAGTTAPDVMWPPPEDASAGVTDREACDFAARENDGAAPASVMNNGRFVNCGALSDASAPADASADAASSADASADGADAADAAASDAQDSDGSADAAPDASDPDAADGAG